MLIDVDVDARQKLGIGYYYVSSLKFIDSREQNTAKNVTAMDLSYRNRFHISRMRGSWNILLRDLGGPYFTGVDHVWRDRQGFLGVAMEF
jgi:hypothetical protein